MDAEEQRGADPRSPGDGVVGEGSASPGEGGGGGGGAEVSAARVKGSWSQQEDAMLSQLVAQFGPRNWSMIARGIPGRSGKSCRLRWCNQLDPAIKRKPFTGKFSQRDDKIYLPFPIPGGEKSVLPLYLIFSFSIRRDPGLYFALVATFMMIFGKNNLVFTD